MAIKATINGRILPEYTGIDAKGNVIGKFSCSHYGDAVHHFTKIIGWDYCHFSTGGSFNHGGLNIYDENKKQRMTLYKKPGCRISRKIINMSSNFVCFLS